MFLWSFGLDKHKNKKVAPFFVAQQFQNFLRQAVVEYMSTGGAKQCLSLFNPTPTKFGVKETIKVIRQPVLQFEMASVFG